MATAFHPVQMEDRKPAAAQLPIMELFIQVALMLLVFILALRTRGLQQTQLSILDQ